MQMTIQLPEPVFQMFERAASIQGKSTADLASDLVTSCALESLKVANGPKSTPEIPAVVRPHASAAFSRDFKVREALTDPNTTSLDWAQQFIDRMLDDPKNAAMLSGSGGVTFDRNYGQIERIYTRETGFIASFYGQPETFRHIFPGMKRGRGLSYSRMAIKTEEELATALKCVEQARRNKVGR